MGGRLPNGYPAPVRLGKVGKMGTLGTLGKGKIGIIGKIGSQNTCPFVPTIECFWGAYYPCFIGFLAFSSGFEASIFRCEGIEIFQFQTTTFF